MAHLIDTGRYPDLPIVQDDTPICLRGVDNICKAIGRANLTGLTSITRVVGGGSTHSSLGNLLRDHKTQLSQLASIKPEVTGAPVPEWRYVPIKRVNDLLEVADATEIMPYALQYSGTFEELIPSRFLLAAEVEIINPRDDSNQPQKHEVITGICNSYARKAIRLHMPRILGDTGSHQFTYGTTATNPDTPKYYLHDIEPRMVRIF